MKLKRNEVECNWKEDYGDDCALESNEDLKVKSIQKTQFFDDLKGNNAESIQMLNVVDNEFIEMKQDERIVDENEHLNEFKPELKIEIPIVNHAVNKLKAKFIEEIQEGPTVPCVSCNRLQFPLRTYSISVQSFRDLSMKVQDNASITNVSVCYTCRQYILGGKIPSMYHGNGYELNCVPVEVQDLNQLEVLLVSLCIPFMKLSTSSHRSGQKKLQGNVVNVPCDLTASISIYLV